MVNMLDILVSIFLTSIIIINVYKYTLGMTVALAIVSRILNGDQKQKEAYLSFLKQVVAKILLTF